MREGLHISDVRFSPTSRREAVRGLLGFISLHYGQFRLSGIAARRTRDGGFALSFPARRRGGVAHPLIRPLDADARAAIEAAVLAELAARGELP